MSEIPAEHDALSFARNLERIANVWPSLRAQLPGGGGGDRSGVRPMPGSKMPASAHVIDVIAEIRDWVMFLTHVLVSETDWTPPLHVGTCRHCEGRGHNESAWCIRCDGLGIAPTPPSTASLLRSIAEERVGHFTEHEDQSLALAVQDDAQRLATLAQRTAHPSGKRTVRLGIPCESYGTSDHGERTVCTGQYATTMSPDERIGDLVCTQDPAHRMTPLEWQRSQRHDAARDRDLDQLLNAPRVRHTS